MTRKTLMFSSLAALLIAGNAVAGGLCDGLFGLLRSVDADADRIEALAYQVRDPYVRDQLLAETARLERDLAGVRAEARRISGGGYPDGPGYGPGRPPTPPPVTGPPPGPPRPPHGPPPGPQLYPTSDADFGQILRAVDAEWFGDGKLAVLRDASRGRAFSTAQVQRLMGTFAFDDDKVEAAALLFPQVADPWNWYTVYGSLTFGSSKDALRRRTTG